MLILPSSQAYQKHLEYEEKQKYTILAYYPDYRVNYALIQASAGNL